MGYGIVGCVEACVPGKQQGVTAGGHINVAKALELALNEGRSMITGEQIGLPTRLAETFKGFDDLWQAYVDAGRIPGRPEHAGHAHCAGRRRSGTAIAR